MKHFYKTFLTLIILFVWINQSVVYAQENDLDKLGLNGNVRSIRTKTQFQEFNKLGNLTNESEFYSNGVLSKKTEYQYNSENRLKTTIETDYYGGNTTINKTEFQYDKDSLIKVKGLTGGKSFVRTFYRNKGNYMTKLQYHLNDTLINTFKYEYDDEGNIINENWFGGVAQNHIKKIKRSFKNNLIQNEHITKFTEIGDTIIHQNIYSYEDNEKTVNIKYTTNNESGYELHTLTYGKNYNLIEQKLFFVDTVKVKLSESKWDQYGTIIEYSIIDSRSKKKTSWTSKLIYDAMNNWVLKENFENGKLYSIEKREIIYYK